VERRERCGGEGEGGREGGGEVGGLIVFWAERQTARSSVYFLTVLSLKVLNLPQVCVLI